MTTDLLVLVLGSLSSIFLLSSSADESFNKCLGGSLKS